MIPGVHRRSRGLCPPASRTPHAFQATSVACGAGGARESVDVEFQMGRSFRPYISGRRKHEINRAYYNHTYHNHAYFVDALVGGGGGGYPPRGECAGPTVACEPMGGYEKPKQVLTGTQT